MPTSHEPAVCKKTGPGYFRKSWTWDFVCPECGRKVRANTNFLGQRVVMCDGIKTARVATIGDFRRWFPSAKRIPAP